MFILPSRVSEKSDYFMALVVFLITYILLLLFSLVFLKFFKAYSKRSKYKFDDLLIHIFDTLGYSFYFFISLFVASLYINFGSISNYVTSFFLGIFVYYGVRALSLVLGFFANKYIEVESKKDKDFNKSVVETLKFLGVLTLWTFGFLLILQNLGINVSSFIAALGVGGIAVGFALQSVLKDLFAYFSIFFDKPFKEGDYITFGQTSGTVEKIGIKTTKLRELRGEQVIVPNTLLTESEVNNFKRLKERRVVLNLGITYETPYEKVKALPKIIEESIKSVKIVRFDRAHFSSYGQSSLDFEVVFYVDSDDYTFYMDKLQEVNLNIFKNFEKHGVSFAYPTQTLFVKK